MAARSSGMFPKHAAWVDLATLLPADGSDLSVPPLNHSGTVHFLAYFSADAVGSVTVELSNGYQVVLDADGERNRKVIAVRSGYEIGDMGATPTAKRINTNLSAGTAQVSVF